MRGILKRASAACHPESESSKENCTGHRARLDATPLSLKRRIISIRYTTKHHHKDCTGRRHEWCDETGPELAQGVIQPSSSGDTGDDVAMEGENADERGAGHLNPSGPDSRRRITTKREPREARDEQSIATSARPEEDVREDDPAGSCGCCHHARGIGRVP